MDVGPGWFVVFYQASLHEEGVLARLPEVIGGKSSDSMPSPLDSGVLAMS